METVTINDGQATYKVSENKNSFNTSSDVPTGASGVASARSADFGSAQAGASISADSIVDIGGIQMRVQDAVRAGALAQNPDGSYSDNYKAPQQQTAQQAPPKPNNPLRIETPRTQQQDQIQQQVDQIPAKARLQGDAESQFQEFNASLPGEVVQHAMHVMSSGQDLSDTLVGDLASRLHMEPHELRAKIEPIHEAFAIQAGQEIASYGLDPEAVREWAQENTPDLMKQASFEHFNLRSTDGYNAVAHEYLKQLDKVDPDAILNAELGEGISATIGNRGEILLNTPHGQMSWASAISTGLVNVSAMKR
ncbi:MAG: hypothetical protein ABW085_16835 [Sedimenticola sp.]